jgi:SAM-dependent methyltransferase
MTTQPVTQKLAQALWRIYQRPDRPAAWVDGGNLPWNEPGFSQRMLREHLDESHSAASRVAKDRQVQIDWLWAKLGLQAGMRVLDITCGPGLYAVEFARRGCTVTGIDFSPASVVYAKELAARENVSTHCTFIEQDVRAADFGSATYDVALFLYGQLGVFRQEEAQVLLAKSAQALKAGGRLAVELLNQERVDQKTSTWWYTDDRGLWGDAPFLHLGERFWDAEQQLSIERFTILHLETGKLDEVILCDQSYAIPTMTALLRQAGFAEVASYPTWDGLPFYDAQEWVVYIANL